MDAPEEFSATNDMLQDVSGKDVLSQNVSSGDPGICGNLQPECSTEQNSMPDTNCIVNEGSLDIPVEEEVTNVTITPAHSEADVSECEVGICMNGKLATMATTEKQDNSTSGFTTDINKSVDIESIGSPEAVKSTSVENTTDKSSSSTVIPICEIKVEPDISVNVEENTTSSMSYRVVHVSDSSDDSSSSDSEINQHIQQADDDGSDDEEETSKKHGRANQKRKQADPMKTKGEFSIQDLPPIEELQIEVPEDLTIKELGTISSILGVLVIVQSKMDSSALNMDSILFVEDRKPLGRVFETFGPVVSPLYAVRFNSPEEITEKGLELGMVVYFAPTEEAFTQYVFLAQLKREKGSDASWENNNEPPQKYLDYSDDESERRAKCKQRGKPRNNEDEDENDDGDQHTKVRKRRNRDKNTWSTGEKNSNWSYGKVDSWPPKEHPGERSQEFSYKPPQNNPFSRQPYHNYRNTRPHAGAMSNQQSGSSRLYGQSMNNGEGMNQSPRFRMSVPSGDRFASIPNQGRPWSQQPSEKFTRPPSSGMFSQRGKPSSGQFNRPTSEMFSPEGPPSSGQIERTSGMFSMQGQRSSGQLNRPPFGPFSPQGQPSGEFNRTNSFDTFSHQGRNNQMKHPDGFASEYTNTPPTLDTRFVQDSRHMQNPQMSGQPRHHHQPNIAFQRPQFGSHSNHH